MSPPLDAISRTGMFAPDPADRNVQRARELRKQATGGGLSREKDGADLSVEALENADAVRSVNDNASEEAHEDHQEQGGEPGTPGGPGAGAGDGSPGAGGRRGKKRAKPDKPRLDLKG